MEHKSGALRLNVDSPDELEELSESCALDVADEGPHTLPEVASMLHVSRQRISQVEIGALRKLRAAIEEFAGPEIVGMLPAIFNPPDEADEDEDMQETQ